LRDTLNGLFGAPGSEAEVRLFNRRLPTYHIHNDCDIAGIRSRKYYTRYYTRGPGLDSPRHLRGRGVLDDLSEECHPVPTHMG